MQAVVVDRYGGPDVLQVADVDEPHAGPGLIRVAVRASSVNPIDAAVRIALARGARVIGTAGEANHDYLRQLGADATTYGEGLVERVRELGGADLAFDTAGRGEIPDLVELTGSPDRVITIADYSAPRYGVRVTGASDGRAVNALAEAAQQFVEGKVQPAGRRGVPVRGGGRGPSPQRGGARPREADPDAVTARARPPGRLRQTGCAAR